MEVFIVDSISLAPFREYSGNGNILGIIVDRDYTFI